MTDRAVARAMWIVPLFVAAAFAFDNGGQNPTSWGPAATALSLAAAGGVAIRGEFSGGRGGAIWTAACAVLTGWVALSFVWSDDRSATAFEVERMAVYLALVLAFASLAGRAQIQLAVIAVAVIINAVCVWSLVDRESNTRLTGTIGYWNALGLLAAIGFVVCLGLTFLPAAGRWRGVAATGLLPTAATAYLTYSRGALIAIGVGLAAMALVRREWTLTWRWPVVAVTSAGVIAAVGGLLLAGLGRDITHRFEGRSGRASSDAQAVRLLSVSGTGRIDLWGVAWDDYRGHPVLGIGAGAWARTWYRHGDARVGVTAAHNLYLETLAELGPIGLIMLSAMAGLPVVIGIRRRGDPLVACALGGYAAFLVHAAFDYDWQVPAVTTVALVLGGCVVVADSKPIRVPRAARVALTGASTLLALVSVVGYVGVNAAAAAADDLAAGRVDPAARAAYTARRWQPWSAAPLILLGQAELAGGRTAAAQATSREAVRRDPGNYLAWYLLGRTSAGQTQVNAYRRTLELAPLAPEMRLVCQAGNLRGVCRVRRLALSQADR